MKTRLGDLKFEQGYPTEETKRKVFDEIDYQRCRAGIPVGLSVAQEPWTEVKGDEVTLLNVRNCDCRTETDYTPAAPELVAWVIGPFRDSGCNAR